VAKIQDIIRLKGNGNFTDIYFNNGTKKMVCRFLKHFDELLDQPFIRIHKSHIINLNCVKSYNKGGIVTLIDNSEIELSATYKTAFLNAFGR
jgi:two-component system LytT family response regulator